MARDPGTGRSPYAPTRKQPKTRQPSVQPFVENPLLRYPTLPPTADRPKRLDPLVAAGAVLVKTPSGIKAYFPSKPSTGKNDLIGLAPKDRAAVTRIRNETLGKPRRAFEFATELTGVPAIARSAVNLAEHPSVLAALGLAGNTAMATPVFRPGRALKLAEDAAAAGRKVNEAALHARLAEIDGRFEKIIEPVAQAFEPANLAQEQRLRNMQTGAVRKARSGKTATGAVKGSNSRWTGTNLPKTAREEARMLAERHIVAAARANPDKPGAQQLLAELEEAQKIRAFLDARSLARIPGEDVSPIVGVEPFTPVPVRPVAPRAAVTEKPPVVAPPRAPVEPPKPPARPPAPPAAPPPPPPPTPPVPPPQPGGIGGLGTPAEFSAAMKEASRLRGAQERGYHAERSKRAAAVAQAHEIGGIEGHKAALAALKGELPKLRFGGFENFDEGGLEAVLTHIQQHSDLRPYEKVSTSNAILGVLDGKVPTRSEIVLLNKVFGEQTTQDILDSQPFWMQAKNLGLDLINIPRTIMSSYDLSAPFRQGLLFGVSHPVMFGKNFPTMIRSGVSKDFEKQVMADIAARPNATLYEQARLPLTDFGADMTQREELFASKVAGKIPGVGFSSRAYTAFLNKSRADYFDWMVERLQQARPDLDVESPEGLKILRTFSRVVGNATGRGEFKHAGMAQAAPILNAVFFAPRLVKSRLDVIANPAYYMEVLRTPVARQEALKHLIGLASTVAGIGYLAKLGGAHVEMDPRNADWAKIKLGNTRIDIAAGFQQPLRVIAQLATGTIISSTTGKRMQLAGGYGDVSKADIIGRFAQTKLSPPASLTWDFFKGSDFEGKPFAWKRAVLGRMLPLLVQDTASIYQDKGPAAAVGAYGLGMWGIGFQNYGAKPPRPRSGSSYAPSGTSGGSPYAPSSQGSGSPYAPAR